MTLSKKPRQEIHRSFTHVIKRSDFAEILTTSGSHNSLFLAVFCSNQNVISFSRLFELQNSMLLVRTRAFSEHAIRILVIVFCILAMVWARQESNQHSLKHLDAAYHHVDDTCLQLHIGSAGVPHLPQLPHASAFEFHPSSAYSFPFIAGVNSLRPPVRAPPFSSFTV